MTKSCESDSIPLIINNRRIRKGELRMTNTLFPITVIGSLPRPAWVRELDEAYLKRNAMCQAAELLRTRYA